MDDNDVNAPMLDADTMKKIAAYQIAATALASVGPFQGLYGKENWNENMAVQLDQIVGRILARI